MSSATRAALLAAMKKSMIDGDKETLAVVRMLVTEVKNAEKNDLKEPGRERNEAEVVAAVAAYHKNLGKTLAEYPADRREPLRREMVIVETFLPKQLDAAQLRNEIDALLASSSERGFGPLMKVASAHFAGRADGKLVSETLKAALASSPE
jgi:uncharacterized protein YqeY